MPKEKDIVGIVKQKLWALGYRVVARTRDVDGFDLLAAESKRVFVTSVQEGIDSEKKAINIPSSGRSDVIAVVEETLYKKMVVTFLTTRGKEISVREAFGLPASKKDNHGKKNTEKEGRKGTRKEKAATKA